MGLHIADVSGKLPRREERTRWSAWAGITTLAVAFAQPVAAATPPPSPYDCLIEPAQTVELGTPVTGMVDKVLVQRGDRVKRGQVLAILESHAEQAAADLARYKSQLAGPSQMAEAKIEFADRKFARGRDMAAETLMSPQDRDDAEAELRTAKAELQTAKENRESCFC